MNTLCLYDYPEPAINPQTKGYSVGRYRTDRTASDFGKRAKVIDAFRKMINTCADKKFELVISYSENSLVKIYDILRLAEERYHVRVDKVELKHSSQGRATETDQNVKEFLFLRATSQADMLACPFGDCRKGQIPRSSAAQQA